jgi:hypothetical protein
LFGSKKSIKNFKITKQTKNNAICRLFACEADGSQIIFRFGNLLPYASDGLKAPCLEKAIFDIKLPSGKDFFQGLDDIALEESEDDGGDTPDGPLIQKSDFDSSSTILG